MISCDPKGPLMMLIARIIPSNKNERFFIFGRIFSGKIQYRENVRLLEKDYIPGKSNKFHITKISSVMFIFW